MNSKPSKLRRRLAIAAVGAGLFLAPFGVAAQPASAMVCDESIEPACFVAATVICKVFYKGQPCLA